MASRIDHEQIQLLLKQSGLNDRQVGERIGVHQATVWRLRNRKIQKVDKYIERLRGLVSVDAGEVSGFDVERLAALARESPALKSLLISLTQFMQEDAMKLRGDAQ